MYVGAGVDVVTQRVIGPEAPVNQVSYQGPYSQSHYNDKNIDLNSSSNQQQMSSVDMVVSNSAGGQLNLVGFYGEVSWYMSGVAGQDAGFLCVNNIGWETYRTDHFGFRTEAASIGPGAGLIFYTGNPSDLNRNMLNGTIFDIQLSFSVVFGDMGGTVGVAPVSIPNRNGTNYLLFLGSQVSIGLSTPTASGGVTKGKTYIHDWK